MILKISKWFCRLGNNIQQMANVIQIALYYNYNIIIPYHRYFNKTKIIINNDIIDDDEYYEDPESSNFFFVTKIKKFDMKCLGENILKMREILRDLFIFKFSDIPKLDDNDVVIHIRSGDIFSTNPHQVYIMPPLSYYIEIINNNNFKNIYLIAEDTLNPCINALLNMYPNIIFKMNTLDDDIKMILSSPNIVASFGTFINALLCFTDYTKTLYRISYSYENNRICNPENKIKVIIKNLKEYYIKMYPWKNTEEQYNIMLTYGMDELLQNNTNLASIQPDEHPVELQSVESLPVESLPVELLPVESQPVESQSVELLPVELLPVELLPVESQPVESQPVESQPVESQSVLVEISKPQPKPVESQSVPVEISKPQPKPVEPKPHVIETPKPQPKPVEIKPQSKPVEIKPQPKPVEIKPQPNESKPQPKPVEIKPQSKPVEIKPQPNESKPQPKPVEIKPQPKPVEIKPQPKPNESKPQSKPVEIKLQSKPVEIKLIESAKLKNPIILVKSELPSKIPIIISKSTTNKSN